MIYANSVMRKKKNASDYIMATTNSGFYFLNNIISSMNIDSSSDESSDNDPFAMRQEDYNIGNSDREDRNDNGGME